MLKGSGAGEPCRISRCIYEQKLFSGESTGFEKNKVEDSSSDAQKVKHKTAIVLNLHCYTCYSRVTK